MLTIQGPANLHRIVVLNPKGGSGKTTLAFNLAGYLAVSGRGVALIDMDPQGSSANWLAKRTTELAPIHGVAAPARSADRSPRGTITLPSDIEYAVIDAPAGVSGPALADYTVGSHAIIVPVLPSEIDIHAASRLITDLLLVARVSRSNRRLGIIANRVKEHTIAYKQLMMFLDRLSIAVVGVLRDSQNYVSVAREGRCIHELPPSQAGRDHEQWAQIAEWLEDRLATPLTERDLAVPKTARRRPAMSWRRRWGVAAAGLAAVALVGYAWLASRPSPTAEPAADLAPTSAVRQAGAEPQVEAERDADDAATAAEVPSGTPVTDPDGQSAPSPGGEAGVLAAPARSSASGISGSGPATGEVIRAPGPIPAEAPAATRLAVVDDQARTLQDGDAATVAGAAESEAFQADRTDRWQLRGVAQAEEDRAVLLTDPTDSSSETATNTRDIDGWLVKEAGRNFAVLVKEDREVRLKLNEESAGAE